MAIVKFYFLIYHHHRCPIAMDEPLVSRGVASTLRLLMDRGILRKEYVQKAPSKRIEYKDEHGRSLTPKEAFKLLSHKFHGKTPGKLKTEKLLKKIQTEKAVLAKQVSSIPTANVQLLEKTRMAHGTAHIVVANSSMMPASVKSQDTKTSHKKTIVPKRKLPFGMVE